MGAKFWFRLAVVGAVVVAWASCHTPTEVFLVSPAERYDHNRALLVYVDDALPPPPEPEESVPGADVDEEDEPAESVPRELETFDYSPWRPEEGVLAPEVRVEGRTSADVLMTALWTPVFSGLPLPLTGRADDPASDRGDLIRYLGEGTSARAGIEPRRPVRTADEVLQSYGPLLELLADETALASDAVELARRLEPAVDEFADVVHDTRYPAGTFDQVLAARRDQHWFVLFQPEGGQFSRLVVQPIPGEGQRYDLKRP